MNKHHSTGSRWLLLVVPLITVLIVTPALAAEFDVRAPGASVTINGAIFYQNNPGPAAGTGVFESFLRVQGNGTERGYNTDGALEFDTKAGLWTHSILLSAIPQVTKDGVCYREFGLDVNETKGGDLLSLDEVQIFQADAGNLTGYVASPPSIGGATTLIWNMDGNEDNWAILDYDASGSGSGRADYILLVPCSLFNARPYVYLYTEMGYTTTPPWQVADSDDGFEEWGVIVARTASPTLSTTPSAGGPIGTVLNDTATLSGGNNPTGSITFDLYGPDNTTCAPPAIYSQVVPLSGVSATTSPGWTTVAAGTYRWIASYPGDANNNAANSGCQDEQVTIWPDPTFSTTPRPAIAKAGATLKDTATIGGLVGSGPFGTITFKLYNNATCGGTPIWTETVPVTGNGTYTSPIGYVVPAGSNGTWQWVASYSGDANNNGVTGACGDEPVLVDTTPPLCVLTGTRAGPPKQIDVTVQDPGSGLASVVVTVANNLTVAWAPPWSPGATFPVVYTATKINQALGAQFGLRVTDVAGNVTTCDPLDLTVNRETGEPATATFTGIPQAESKIMITNGDPGLTNLRIVVNGWQFQVAGLKAGEVRELDVAQAMKAGNDNTISFTGLGKPGDSASVLVHD